jgi:hypothetical protein
MNAIPDTEARAYRKNLSTDAIIYLGFEELPIQVVNLSLTGLLAEFSEELSAELSIRDIFQRIQVSPIVDIYLPEMQVAGEAKVARVELVDNRLQMGIEFHNLTYDTNNLLYKRRAYRKNLKALGQLLVGDSVYAFNTENVSVDGLMARVKDLINPEAGDVVHFSFRHLELQGEAEVVWVDHDEQSTLIGLKYLLLEREHLPPVPRFSKPGQVSA